MDKCDKPHLKYLHDIQKNDVRSVYGSNVRNICHDAHVDRMSRVLLSNISYAPIHSDDQWRVPVIQELLEARAGRLCLDLSKAEINYFLFSVLTF